MKHHAMKSSGGSGVITPPFLTSEVGVGELSALCPSHFTPGERAPGTHWIGGWGESQTVGKSGVQQNCHFRFALLFSA
jgi:hypothetical protein